MKIFLIALVSLLLLSLSNFSIAAESSTKSSPSIPCASNALAQAKKLLAFHSNNDKRIAIDQKVNKLSPIKNPAGKGKFDVIEIWGYIYKARYRMHLIYAQIPNECVLMGQEILEYANP